MRGWLIEEWLLVITASPQCQDDRVNGIEGVEVFKSVIGYIKLKSHIFAFIYQFIQNLNH